MEEWRNFLCRHLGHHRDRAGVQFNSLEQCYESVCKRCRIKMVRTPEREWKIADVADD